MNPTFLYVALVFFLAVWIWRRLGGDFPWRIALFFYLLVLVFLFRPMTQSWVHLPMDYLFRLNPWSELLPGISPQNPELNDLTLQIVPWAHQVRESWKSFEPPLWNDAAAAGYPLLANGQSAAFSVLRLIALPLPLDFSFTCEAALKLLIAMGATFLFLRRRGSSEPAAIVAAVSFAFSTAILIWLHFPLATVSVWLPAVFLGIDLLIERRSFARFLFLALVFTQLLVGGHPETAAHVVFGAGIWLLFRLLAPSAPSLGGAAPASVPPTRAVRWKVLVAVCGAGVVSILLALPQVLPLLEALPSTKRWDMLEQFPDMHDRPTSVKFLMNFIQPAFFGNVREKTAWGPAHAEVIAGYGGILLGAAWVGVLAWTIVERRWRDERSLIALTVPLMMGIVLNWPVISDAFEALPLFSLAANGRLRLLVVWFAALLVAAAIDLARGGVRWPLGAGAAAMLAALLSGFFLNSIDPGTDPWTYAVITSTPGAIVLILTLAAVMVPARWFRWALPVLLIAVVAELMTQAHPINPVLPRAMFYPRTPLIERMTEIREEERSRSRVQQRIAGTNATLFPNTQAIYGFEDIRGHDPMANSRVLGAMRVFAGYSSDDYFGMLRDVSHPIIDYMNVQYVLTTRHEELPEAAWERVYSGPDGKIFRNLEVLPRFFGARYVVAEFDDAKRTELLLENQDWRETAIAKRLPSQLMPAAGPDLFGERAQAIPPATVIVTRAAGDEFAMDVEGERWTLVVSSQPDWPGWRVVRNGRERLKTIEVNAAFMAFLVPPGSSKIEVYYAPLSFWVGVWIALATSGGLLAAGLLSLRRRRAVPASNL